MSDLSRVEQLLRNALGEDIYEVTPQSRIEVLLAQLNELIEGLDTSVDPEAIASIVTGWLAENIHDGAVVDSSLSVAGAAAESKKVGDEISDLKEGLTQETARAEAEEARIEALFTAPTQEAVDNWLAEHPEATTTVQDGSLTEAKLSESLAIKTVKDYVTPEMFRAKGDGITNDRQAIVDAFEYAYNHNTRLYFPKNVYYSNSEIVINDVPMLEMDGTIVFPLGNGLTLGKTSGYINGKTLNVNVGCSGADDGTEYVGLKIVNAVNSIITINYVYGFRIGVELIGNSGAFAYNTIIINHIRSVNKALVLSKVGSGYNNENLFIGGRFVCTTKADSIGITVIGNNHVFLKPCLENMDTCFDFTGQQSDVISCRSENSNKLAHFNDNAYFNVVGVGYGVTNISGNCLNRVKTPAGLATNTAGKSEFALGFANTVYDSSCLANKITIGDSTTTLESPLSFFSAGDTAPTRNANSAYFGSGNSANEIMLNGGAIGVMVDCSIAKEFIVLQAGSGLGKVLVKLYDANGDSIDVSNVKISSYSAYTSYYGGALLETSYGINGFVLPDNAKKAFIGISKITGTSLMTFAIKSTALTVVVP